MKVTTPRAGLFRLSRAVLSRAPVPGRYVAAEAVYRFFGPATGIGVERVGRYEVEFDLRDGVQRQMYFGLYEPHMVRLLHRRLCPRGVFYDVGANVGYLTLLASSLVGEYGEVHAFEPIPANTDRIKRNRDRNGIENITLNEVAVSDGPGVMTLYLPESVTNSGWASVVPSPRRTTELVVAMRSLDDYVLNEGRSVPDLVKLDIEGAEPRALAGMKRLLAHERAPDVVVEINPYLLDREGLTASDTLGPLRDAGYHLYRLGARRLAPLPRDPAMKSTDELLDVFATKRPPAETSQS